MLSGTTKETSDMDSKSRGNTLKVFRTSCNDCLFSNNRIVSYERAAEIIYGCLENDNWFVCHKSLLDEGDVCCSSFFGLHKRDVLPLRLAVMCNAVEWIDQRPA